MSQIVKGFFGREGQRERDREGRRDRIERQGHKQQQQQQLSEESDGQLRDLDDQSFEPMELTSDKRSNQVEFSTCKQSCYLFTSLCNDNLSL